MKYNPITRAMAAWARRQYRLGDTYHRIAMDVRVNPADIREAVTGETFTDITDPPPIPEPPNRRIGQWYEPTMPEVIGPELYAKIFDVRSEEPEPKVPARLKPVDRTRKLTLEGARAIRAAHAAGARGAHLAKEYGVSSSTISNIVTGKQWKEH
jgi:predicted transcriptional regulator